VALERGPREAGIAGVLMAALLRAENHLNAILAAGIGRASVAVFYRRGSRASIDRRPFLEGHLGAEERDLHTGDHGGHAAGVRHHSVGMTTEDTPPVYGTTASAVPRNEITVIGRGGLQSSTFSAKRSHAAGATAANTSAAWHAK